MIYGFRDDAPPPSWSADATPILSLTFPQLKSVEVWDMRCSAEALRGFLERHEPSLESIKSRYSSVESGPEDGLGQGDIRKWDRKGSLRAWGVQDVEGPDGVDVAQIE